MRELAQKVILLWGWRRLAVAFLAGAASTLAQAPVHFAPVLWLTLPVLVWLFDGIGPAPAIAASGRFGGLKPRLAGAALIGWTFGFGYFLAGLYWVGYAFLVEAETFGWLLPFAVALLPAGLALFHALAGMAAIALWSAGPARIFALAASFTAAEWLRGHAFSGFPWNTLGDAFAFADAMMQSAALVGVWGLTFATVLIFASPAVAGTAATGAAGRRAWALPLAAAALLPLAFAWGTVRLPDGPVATHPDIRLRLVQPNVAQREKWRPENASRIFAGYLDLSNLATSPESSGIADVTHVIWPESALPFLLSERPDARAAIAAMLPPGTQLITGAARREPPPSTSAFNSIHALDSEGRIFATYDKAHLVPFGEYLPLQGVLERLGLRQLTRVLGGFAAGPGPRTLALPGAPPVSPLICYEIIFSRATIDRAERPEWMLNVTNDAWYGDTSGPRQHLHQARMRAVEEGLPVIRVANTGISAIIDPYGRLVDQLPLNRRGVIDGGLPLALAPTFYANYGNFLPFITILFGFTISIIGKFTKRRTKTA